ncbi:hypothetical protein G3N55_06910, partial [Dissulfurirhabdus thermomarina]
AGGDPQVVASNLQNLLLKMASEMGLEVVTYRTGPVRKWRDERLAVTTFTFKTQTYGLVRFLKRLEDDGRLVRLETLNVAKVQGRSPHLRVTLEVAALCL